MNTRDDCRRCSASMETSACSRVGSGEDAFAAVEDLVVGGHRLARA